MGLQLVSSAVAISRMALKPAEDRSADTSSHVATKNGAIRTHEDAKAHAKCGKITGRIQATHPGTAVPGSPGHYSVARAFQPEHCPLPTNSLTRRREGKRSVMRCFDGA